MLPDHFVVYNMVYMVYNNIVLYNIVLYGVQYGLYGAQTDLYIMVYNYQSDNLLYTHM